VVQFFGNRKKVNYLNISDEDARKGMKDMDTDWWTIVWNIRLADLQKSLKNIYVLILIDNLLE
jgi:hypothetical protein